MKVKSLLGMLTVLLTSLLIGCGGCPQQASNKGVISDIKTNDDNTYEIKRDTDDSKPPAD